MYDQDNNPGGSHDLHINSGVDRHSWLGQSPQMPAGAKNIGAKNIGAKNIGAKQLSWSSNENPA